MRVDMHAHYIPPKALTAIEQDATSYGIHLKAAVESGGQCACFNYGLSLRPFHPRLFDLEERWEEMARMGVDRQLLSGWADLFGYGMPVAEGRRWHRLLNEQLGETVQENCDRLSGLVSVPLQDGPSAARELEHGVTQIGAVGVVIAANVDNVNLGEVPLDDFWAAAVELDVPVFIHPTQPSQPLRTRKHSMLQIVQFTYDTTATVGSLIFNGVLDRFPTLKLILSHGGGYFPYQVGRFDRIYKNMQTPSTPAQAPSAYLRQFYYDTILYDAAAIKFLRDLVGVDRLLMGTDYPFPVVEQDPVRFLQASGFSPADVDQIGGELSCQLFKL